MDDQAVWRRGAPVRFPSARWELTFSRALRREKESNSLWQRIFAT